MVNKSCIYALTSVAVSPNRFKYILNESALNQRPLGNLKITVLNVILTYRKGAVIEYFLTQPLLDEFFSMNPSKTIWSTVDPYTIESLNKI